MESIEERGLMNRDKMIWSIIFAVDLLGLYISIQYYKNILLTPIETATFFLDKIRNL